LTFDVIKIRGDPAVSDRFLFILKVALSNRTDVWQVSGTQVEEEVGAQGPELAKDVRNPGALRIGGIEIAE
jgi:hypothetical protein